MSPSGKARDFDSLTRGFESRLPSQRPLGGGCDPLAQLAEHLTFNQGVRSSNLRWITSKFPLKSSILAILGDFLCPFSIGTFLRILRYFTLFYDKMYTKMYTTPFQSFTKLGYAHNFIFIEQGRFSVLPGSAPAIGTKGSSQDARGLFSALLNSLYRIPFIC